MHSKRSTQATIKRHTLNVTVQHHLNYETSAEPKPLHVLPKEAVFNTVIKHINDVMGQYVPEGFAKPYSEAVDVWSLEPLQALQCSIKLWWSQWASTCGLASLDT